MNKRKKIINTTIFSIFLAVLIVLGNAMGNLTTPEQNSKESLPGNIIVPDDYPTIQEAINHAIMGETIIVKRGEYKENINVNKMITITGSGSSGTIITGDTTDDVVTFSADGISFSSFTIQNSGHNHAGIQVNSHYNRIDRCIIKNNGNGIILYASSGNFIRNNTIKQNSKSGFWLYRSHANEINGNELRNNNNGMQVNFSCLGNQVKGNIVTESEQTGVQLSQTSRSNTFIANNIKQNGDYGVKVIGSSDSNQFHHNDFVQNAQNAYDTSMNYWNDSLTQSGEGNYWSDYTGVDEDGDGIGDTPYAIPGANQVYGSFEGNQDNFPLMNSNVPTQIKIEVLNIYELTPNTPIDFEVTYRHRIMNQNTFFDEDIFYQVDWDDQSSPEEEEMADEQVYLTHTWNEEGLYNIRIRSFRYVVGERYNSEWFTLPIELSKDDQGNGFFLFPKLYVKSDCSNESIGYQVEVTGLGILSPQLVITNKITTEDQVDVFTETTVHTSSPLFIWLHKPVDEYYNTQITSCDVEISLSVNGQKKCTELITLPP